MWYVALFNQNGGSFEVDGETLNSFNTLEEANLFVLSFTNGRFPHLSEETLQSHYEIDKKTGEIYRVRFNFSKNRLDEHQDAHARKLSDEKLPVRAGIIFSHKAAVKCFSGIAAEGNRLSKTEALLAEEGLSTNA